MTQSYTKQNDLSYRSYLSKTFFTVGLGLVISAICAYIASIIMPVIMYIVPGFALLLMLGLVIGEFALAVYFSSRLMIMPKRNAWICYVLYAVLTGVSFHTLFLYYDLGSLTLAFIATVIMFVCMAIIGKTTRINLVSVYGLLLPAILAGIAITLLNTLLIHSNFIDLAIAYIGLVLFLVLTAADMQKLEAFYNQGTYDTETHEKLMVMGAFQLYLDFINIFVRILRFVGRRNENN